MALIVRHEFIKKAPTPHCAIATMIRALLLASVIALGSVDLSAPTQPLHIQFIHEFDGDPIVADSVRYENDQGEPFSISRLDWLATDFTFTTESGKSIAIPESTAFVSTGGTAFNLADYAGEKITAITFSVGPDEATNHGDPAQYHAGHPLNPALNNLHWNWKGGYIFLAIEGHWQESANVENANLSRAGYAYHFANNPNRTTITLPLNLTPINETRIDIALDVKQLLHGISFAEDGTSTHARQGDPVAAKLKSNLPDAFYIKGIQDGSIPAPPAIPRPIDLPETLTNHPFYLPNHIPAPSLPADNPLITERVVLGEKLFFDERLSKNNNLSCASCHQGATLSDPRAFSTGTDGLLGVRHSMPLFNLAWKNRFFWDGRAASLRDQVLVPIEDHLEMNESFENVFLKLTADPEYRELFKAGFGSGKVSETTLGLALEAFLLTKTSFNSKLDNTLDNTMALTPQESRGSELFFGESNPRLGKRGADCFHCHGGALFSDHAFHNNGLSTEEDIGLAASTGRDSDRFKFSTPTLRNIDLTAPYMHDGRFNTLEEVVEHYNSGITRSETLSPHLAKHENGLQLSEQDKAALVAFLKTLSDITTFPVKN